MIEVRLPEISENVDSGDVVKVLVSPGDVVEKDQPLIELETEKAAFEVPSTAAGTVSEILVAEGDVVKVGQVIAKIDADAASAGATKEPAAEAKPESSPEPEPEPERKSPEREPEPAAQTEETKEPAPRPQRDAVVAEEAPRPAPRQAEVVPMPRTGPAPASPTVRRLARELGIEIHQVPGTGPGGRISAEDVHRFAKTIIQSGGGRSAPASGGAPASQKPLPDFSKYGDIERVAMTRVRQATATNMASAWNTVPAVTQNDEADITELEAARKKYGKLAEQAGGKLTMTAILVKVCAGALRRFPEFNASIDTSASEIVYKKYCNIGVAVDTDFGLLVPVIRDADAKSIIELSAELSDIAARARDRKLKPAEMEGGNFTISNLGGIGGTSFSPIVNTPEVAILGVSRAKNQPVWKDGAFVPRLVMPVSLSYDHRLIDGAAAARFARWVCEALENPILMALDA